MASTFGARLLLVGRRHAPRLFRKFRMASSIPPAKAKVRRGELLQQLVSHCCTDISRHLLFYPDPWRRWNGYSCGIHETASWISRRRATPSYPKSGDLGSRIWQEWWGHRERDSESCSRSRIPGSKAQAEQLPLRWSGDANELLPL